MDVGGSKAEPWMEQVGEGEESPNLISKGCTAESRSVWTKHDIHLFNLPIASAEPL